MKAAVLEDIGQSLTIKEVPRPQVGPDEVLVRTRTCGVCRTDLHIQQGLAYVPDLPHIPGHEASGIVDETGPQVTDVKLGQRVVSHTFAACGSCAYCRTGRHSQCLNVRGILGVTMGGGFAEYFKAPARNLLVVPDSVPFDVAGLASCAGVTAVHAYRKSNIQANDTAVVLGAGGIGLILVQLLKEAGARVVAVARSSRSLELAEQAGADLTVTADAADAAEQVRKFAGPSYDGAQCVFEMVGIAQTMKAAADYVMSCGRIIVIGEEPESPPINTIEIAQRELEIIGSRNGGMQDIADALDLMARGIIQPRIDRRFPLDEINEALDYLRSGQAHGRIVITVGNGASQL